MKTIYIALLVFFVSMLMPSLPSYAADEVHFTITGPDSVAFDWRGSSAADNKISYGTCPGCENVTVQAYTPTPLPFSSSGPFFEARLTGLASNTVYYYKIGANAEKTFKTAPSPGASGFVVVGQGDIGDSTSYSRMPIIQSMIGAVKPDLTLMLGDLTYGADHGQSKIDQHFNDVMVWSQTAAYMPAWGNHEWDSPLDDMRNYLGRFHLPNAYTSPVESSYKPGCPKNLGEDWYWFDYGNTRLIAYPDSFGACGVYSSNSADWTDWFNRVQPIMQDAQNNANIRFIVTFGHSAVYSSGHHDGEAKLRSYTDTLGDRFSKYVLSLNGHSHNYERSKPQHGVTYITAGTGGSSLEQDGACLWRICTKPSWSAVRYMRLGVTRLVFGPTSIEGQFLCGPAGGGTNDVACNKGDVIDSFRINAGSGVTASLKAEPAAIVAGQASTLTWASAEATSCTGAGFDTGAAVSGSVSVSPVATTSYSVNCVGASGSASASATVSVTPPFAYTLSNGGAKTVAAGASASQTISATLTAGATQSVSFDVAGLPAGAALSFPPCAPTCVSTGTIATSTTTAPGAYTINVTGNPNGVATAFLLNVGAAASISKRFDLNTGSSGSGSSPTAAGYTGTPLVAYSSARGYGWQSISAMEARNRTAYASSVGALKQDFHKSTGASGAFDSHFLVDLPNGAYDVTVYIGDADHSLTNQYVDAQGVNVVGPVSTTSCTTSVATCSRAFSFPANVTTGQLDLRFYTTNAASVYYGYIAVEGIDIVAAAR